MSTKKFSISLTNQILLATVIGLILGAVVGPKIEPIGALGTIFLNLVMMGVPIVILGAVTEAVGQLSPSQLGKMGARLFTMFFLSTVIAAVIGVFFALLIQPGVGVNVEAAAVNITGHGKSFSEILVSFFPKNIINALGRGDMMQVIIFALFFGVATSVYLDKTGDDKVLELVKSLNKTILTLIGFVMKIAPIGVGALMAKVAGATGLAVLLPLGKYLFTLFIATALIMLIYILITASYVKVSPIKLIQKVIPMSIMAATTTSSAMSLPIKMKDSEEKLGVSPRISNLVNPLGMVLNSAGQAVFLAIASIFIIQIYNIEIPFTGIIQIVALSTLACMGTLSVPGGALVIFASLMPTLGLPAEGVAFIAGIDWFRGMITTIPNVTGDALIATIIAKQEGEFSRDIFDGKVVHVKEDQ